MENEQSTDTGATSIQKPLDIASSLPAEEKRLARRVEDIALHTQNALDVFDRIEKVPEEKRQALLVNFERTLDVVDPTRTAMREDSRRRSTGMFTCFGFSATCLVTSVIMAVAITAPPMAVIVGLLAFTVAFGGAGAALASGKDVTVKEFADAYRLNSGTK